MFHQNIYLYIILYLIILGKPIKLTTEGKTRKNYILLHYTF